LVKPPGRFWGKRKSLLRWSGKPNSTSGVKLWTLVQTKTIRVMVKGSSPGHHEVYPHDNSSIKKDQTTKAEKKDKTVARVVTKPNDPTGNRGPGGGRTQKDEAGGCGWGGRATTTMEEKQARQKRRGSRTESISERKKIIKATPAEGEMEGESKLKKNSRDA